MIYSKEKMLKNLRQRGLNTFDYKIFHTDAALIYFHRYHKNFTIRFTKREYCPNLPFYVINEGVETEKLVHIGLEAQLMNCAMLISEGIKQEQYQVMNFVFCKQPSGDFILEYRYGKEPLRDMYKYGTSVIRGNLYTEKSAWEFFGKQTYLLGYSDLEYILAYVERTNLFNKYIECTYYAREVGVRKEKVIVWGY